MGDGVSGGRGTGPQVHVLRIRRIFGLCGVVQLTEESFSSQNLIQLECILV